MQEARSAKLACHSACSFVLHFTIFSLLMHIMFTFADLQQDGVDKCTVVVDEFGLRDCERDFLHSLETNVTTTTTIPSNFTTTTAANTTTTPNFLEATHFALALHTEVLSSSAKNIYAACVLMFVVFVVVSFFSCCNRMSRRFFYRLCYLKCPAVYRKTFKMFENNEYTLFIQNAHAKRSVDKMLPLYKAALSNWFLYSLLPSVIFLCIGATVIASSSALYELSLCCEVENDKQYANTIENWQNVLKDSVALLCLLLLAQICEIIFKVNVAAKVYSSLASTSVLESNQIPIVRLENQSDEESADTIYESAGDADVSLRLSAVMTK